MIQQALREQLSAETAPIIGIGGGACGGDILFHEICADEGVETQVFLPIPPAAFIHESVEQSGPGWVERFHHVVAASPSRVLGPGKTLPRWLRAIPRYSIWQRGNLWMLFNALARQPRTLTLIALWDKGRADGPGGTEDLVRHVHDRGHRVVRLPAERLKNLR